MTPVTSEAVDLLVRTTDPAALDTTVQLLGPAAVVGGPDYLQEPGEQDVYRVRCFAGIIGVIEMAIAQQGYGEVLGRAEHLA